VLAYTFHRMMMHQGRSMISIIYRMFVGACKHTQNWLVYKPSWANSILWQATGAAHSVYTDYLPTESVRLNQYNRKYSGPHRKLFRMGSVDGPEHFALSERFHSSNVCLLNRIFTTTFYVTSPSDCICMHLLITISVPLHLLRCVGTLD
jgi:hypothetical protein